MSSLPSDFIRCQFCSDVSRAVGEDPIGTAGYYDYWLVVELPQPWTEIPMAQNESLKPYLAQIKSLVYEQGIKLRPLAIASDPDYSQTGYTRVLFYRRPQNLFAHYTRAEYLIQEQDLGDLVSALLLEPEKLPCFAERQQASDHHYDLLVCTHGNVDAACSRYGYPLYKSWRQQASPQVRVWRCSHFGGHRFAPTAISLPDGRYWGRLTPESFKLITNQEGDLNDLKQYYRGWTGLDQWAQILEQEIWLDRGWEWRNYWKTGEVVEADKNKEWATVRITYASPDGTDKGVYEAKIVSTGEIITAGESGSPSHTAVVKQYQVTALAESVSA